MKAVILFTSRYGYTQSVARELAERLESGNPSIETEVVEAHRWTPIPEAEIVIVGAPIYGGTISGGLVGCLELNLPLLLERKLFFFLSCLNEGDEAEHQLADSIPPRLLAHARARHYVGGRVQFSLLRWMDRQVMKKVAGISGNVDASRPDEIDALYEAVLAAAAES